MEIKEVEILKDLILVQINENVQAGKSQLFWGDGLTELVSDFLKSYASSPTREVTEEGREKIKSGLNETFSGNPYQKQIIRVCLELIDQHKYLPNTREVEGGWINVEDRLPEDEKHVLGINTNGAIMNVGYYPDGAYVACDDDTCELEHDSDDMCRSAGSGWYEECDQVDCEYDVVVFKRVITHWQPLPNPPSVNSKEL